MIGISTTAHKKYTTSKKKKTDLSDISTTAYKKSSKNNGGFLGGLGYVGGNIAAGVAGVGEGIVDLFAAAGAAISGDTEYAKYVFKDNQAGEWHQSLTEDYNPGKVMNFLGDVGHGLGQSSVFLLNAIPGLGQLGTAAFFTGIIGQGISNAADKTGDVGAKEVVYGVGTGVTEGLLETYLGGAAKAAGSIGKGLVGNVAKNAVRRGLAKEILTGAGEEFLEEFVGEYTDVFWQRTTGVDKNASTSLKNAIRSGLVGAVSGGLSVSSTSVIKYGANQQRGKRIIQSGNAQTLVNTATSVADKLAGSGTDFKKAAEWVTALRGDVDAYNKLSPEQKAGAKGQTILGEMQAALAFAELQASFAGVQAKIENSDESTRAAFAEYINQTVHPSKRNKEYTAEDIAKNTDNVAWQIAVLDYVNGIADIDGAIAFEEAAQAKVAGVKSTPEGVVNEGQVIGKTKYAIKEDTFGNVYVDVDSNIVGNSDSPKQIAQALSDIVRTKFNDFVNVKGQKIGINQKTAREWVKSKEASSLLRMDKSKFIDKANAFGNADELLQAAKSYIGEAAKHTRKDSFVEFARGVVDFKVGHNGYSADIIVGTTSGGVAVLYDIVNIQNKKIVASESDTTQDRRHETPATDSSIPQNNPVVNTDIEKNIDKHDLADKPVKNAQEGAERSGKAVEGENAKQSAESENDGKAAKKTAQETENEPKISEAKEALTDEQRKARAVERARKWIEWEKQTTPTAKELNEAREYVKDFDKLQNNRRLAILKMIRSADGKVDKKILKGVANVMAVNPKSDLEFRFSDLGGSKHGLTTEIRGKTVIVIDGRVDFNKTVKRTIAHELVHYLENRAGYEDFAEYVMKRAKPEAKEEIAKKYTDFYRSVFTAEALGVDSKTSFDLDSVPADIKIEVEERLMSKEMQDLIDSEITASLVGKALQSETFLKRYANRDRKFIVKVGSWLKQITSRLKMTEEQKAEADIANEYSLMVDAILQMPAVRESGAGTKYALPSKKDPKKLDPRTVTREDVHEMLVNAADGKYDANTYIPVRISTPAIVIQRIKEKLGVTIPNYPLIMSADKAINAMERKGVGDDGLPNRLSADEIISVIEAMSDPLYIVYEPANAEHTEPRYVEVVKFNLENGRKAFAVLELSGENKDALYINGYEGGQYNVFVTVYPPKSIKIRELLSNKNNTTIYNKKKDLTQRTSGITVPSVLNDPSFFDNSIHQNEPVVNTSEKNILSDNDKKLLFDEEFYSKYKYESREKIVETVDELEMLKNSDDFKELSEDEAFDVNAKLKALKAGYNTVYDYYVETEKKRMLDDYAKNGEKSKTYRLLEEKRKKAEKAQKLSADIASATPLQNAQFEIIQRSNPMYDDYHTGIRSPKEIKTFAEVVNNPDSFTWGDFSREDAKAALKKGTIKVYSSYPIKNGVFVSTSYKQALNYAGMNAGNVHSKTVSLNSTAWINGDEGQYAKVSPNTKFDLADNDAAYMSAVESGDMETVQKMVDEAARRAGYDTPKLYHGTTAFGFTEFDFARSDDNLSVFATTDEDVARTYTDEDPRTSISERVDITPEALENASDEQILSYLQKYVGKNYRIVKTDGSTNAARAYISGAHDKLVAFIGENSERITGQKNAILQKMVAAIETLQTADTYRAFRDAYGEYESSVWDLKWADNELVSDIRPLIVEDLRKAYSVLVTTLSKGGGVAFTDGERVLHRNKAITELKPKLFSGIYKLYGRTGDSFVVEGHGVDWNRIDGRVIGKNVHVTTRDVVEYASRRGYDSVTFKDIVDKGDVTEGGGESTVYAFLRQGALKSADPVTYDDNGKVIPLSQRFNADIADIRYDLADNAADAESLKVEKRIEKLEKEKVKAQAKAKQERSMREKMAYEAAQAARVAASKVYTKQEIKVALDGIEALTDVEILSLAKGLELKGMTKARRDELISKIYILLHSASARGEAGKGSVAVKMIATKIAWDVIDTAKIVDENGKEHHIVDIYDEASVQGLAAYLADSLYMSFANMGEHTSNSFFQAEIRRVKEEFNHKFLNNRKLQKFTREISFQGKKLRDIAAHQKREGVAEGLGKVTKALASVVDPKGNVSVGRIDKAMRQAAVFLEAEENKTRSERSQLSDYAKVSESADVFNNTMKFMVDEFNSMRAGREGEFLTAEEAELLGKILRGMKITIERYNKEYINGHWKDVDQAASDEVNDLIKLVSLEKNKEYKTKIGALLGRKLGKGINEAYFYKILSPEYVLGALESYREGGLLQSMYHSIREAQQKSGHVALQMMKPLMDYIDNKENRWESDGEDGGKKGRKYAYRDKLNVKTINVNGSELTLGEAIYLLMLTKREESHAGLLENGYIVFDENNQRRLEIKLSDINDARDMIYNQLDKTDIEFLSLAEDFFNKTASKIKYDADMKIFGFSNNSDGYYVPMIRDRYSRVKGVTDGRFSASEIVSLYSPSFTKNLVDNANALEGKNIMEIISNHAHGLADYSEMYLPLKAFDRVYNRGVVPNGQVKIRSIREVLNNDIWNGTETYLKDLFQDIQHQRERHDNVAGNLVGKIRSGWVSSVLGANIKVVMTQTTSLGAATQVIEPKYIVPALSVVPKFKGETINALRERAYKYSDIIEFRVSDMGALKAQGNVEKIGEIGKKAGILIEKMDEQVCLTIFHAAELKVEALTGHAVGTEENAKRAAKIADKAIFTTQAMTAPAEKSALQRSTSEVAKTLSMFTSDTVKNLSHLWGNTMKYFAHKQRANAGDTQYDAMLKEDAKDMRRSMRTLGITGLMMGLITYLFKWLYAKEEEEPEERAKDFALDIFSSTFNILPIVSDIFDKFVFNYDVSLNVFDMVNDTIEGTANMFKMTGNAMSGKFVSDDDIVRNSSNFIKSVGAVFGVPIAPVERTVTGLLRRFSPATIYGYNSAMYTTNFTSDLKKAVESGDDRLAEHVIEQMYKDQVNGTYTTEELEEIVRLYSLTDENGRHYNVLPQQIGTTVNDVKLNAKQRKQFRSIYSQASAKVNAMIGSSAYQTLTDEQRARAIKNMYALYYNRAAAQVVGAEWTRAQAYSHLTDKLDLLFVSQAYKSGLTAYKGADGKTVSVKAQLLEYLDSLKVDGNTYTVIAYANGVRDSETTEALLKYINSLGLSDDVKTQVATALGLTVRDGKLIKGE